MVSRTYPSGHVVTYAWTNDLITQVALDGMPIASSIVYRPFGPPQRISAPSAQGGGQV